MSVSLSATPYQVFNVSSGAVYHADASGNINVAAADIEDVMAQGAILSVTGGGALTVSGDITTLTLLGASTELDLVGGAHGAWLFTPTDNSGGAGVGTGDVTSGGTGNAVLYTGGTSSAGTTGHIQIVTGDSAGGVTGDIKLIAGAAGIGTRGSITLDALHVVIANLPTSASGLAAGTLWNSTGTLKVA